MKDHMARFLFRGELKPSFEVQLSAEESHHLSKVLRLTEGTEIELINGLGVTATATILEISKKGTLCRVTEVKTETQRNKIHLVFAIPKSNALDFIIHRCTELGVASFQPVLSHHSLKVSNWNEDRWKKVIFEVAKQCQDSFFPVVHPPVELKKWLVSRSQTQPNRKLIYCDENSREGELEKLASGLECELLIGAEGGWSELERTEFAKTGLALGLGKNRLRAETASLVALTLLKQQLGEI